MASALYMHNLYDFVHILTGPNVHELAIVHYKYDNLDISAIVRPTAVVYMHVVCL